jgi:hypothetical protein
MTALDYLLSFIPELGKDMIGRDIIEQAKEMEKQQIINAVEWGNRKGYNEHILTCILDEDEQYYNQTYTDVQQP